MKHTIRATIFGSQKNRVLEGEVAIPLIEHVEKTFARLKYSGIGKTYHTETVGVSATKVDITIEGTDSERDIAVMQLEPAEFRPVRPGS